MSLSTSALMLVCFAIYLAKRWPLLKVFAFEPFPANFRNCAENLRLNGVTNVVLSPKAIANDNRLLNMATDPHNSGGASAIVRTFESNGIVTDLASMTLDEVFSFNEIGRCKLLKIDCEGMEYEILFGTRVLDKVEYLAGEFHASASLQSRGCARNDYAHIVLHSLRTTKWRFNSTRYRHEAQAPTGMTTERMRLIGLRQSVVRLDGPGRMP